jgi:hypothetical protein
MSRETDKSSVFNQRGHSDQRMHAYAVQRKFLIFKHALLMQAAILAKKRPDGSRS